MRPIQAFNSFIRPPIEGGAYDGCEEGHSADHGRDVVFRWKLRKRPTYDQGMSWGQLEFVIERADEPGALLIVVLPCAHPANWMGESSVVVTPGLVAPAIGEALERAGGRGRASQSSGWN